MKFIAYDLGTGGVKASLHDEALQPLGTAFLEYPTYYPAAEAHQQRPEDWWDAVCAATRALLSDTETRAEEIACAALSGHSLVAVPVGADGRALLDLVPIWSDTTAAAEAEEFFTRVDPEDWYLTTGNGFPAPCYTLFKLMRLARTEPEIFGKTARVLGSKDYINFRLTGGAATGSTTTGAMAAGGIATDPSYASGSGAYSLRSGRFEPRFLEAAGLPAGIFPEIVPSHTVVGKVTAEAAAASGLAAGTPIACGGVDNACMALGAVGPDEGKVYLSLGSSSWIPVNSSEPVLDYSKKPYVFAHIAEGMFTSAFSIFSGGSSRKWVRENILCGGGFDEFDRIADAVAPGSGGIHFNPSLAGGTSQDKSPAIRGAYVGLHLGTTRDELLRAAMEGITLNLKLSYDFMRERARLDDSLLICGGGSQSRVWLQMFADVFGVEVYKTNIDQNAASLGAAAIAARAVGHWPDYSGIAALHEREAAYAPRPEYTEIYRELLPRFALAADALADLGDALKRME